MAIIPPENIAIFLQKFSVSAPTVPSFTQTYNSVGVMTTNAPKARQWQFTFNGYFVSKTSFEIIYDFSKVDTFGYSISFEDNLDGFITVDGEIYAATKYLTFIPQTPQDIVDKIVRFQFKPPCPRSSTAKRSLYYVVNLNDSSCSMSVNLTTIVDKTSGLTFAQQTDGCYYYYLYLLYHILSFY